MNKKMKELGIKNNKKIFNAIKELPIKEGYYITSFSDLGKKINLSYSTVAKRIHLLEQEGYIKTKNSYALFGNMYITGIKILKEYNK